MNKFRIIICAIISLCVSYGLANEVASDSINSKIENAIAGDSISYDSIQTKQRKGLIKKISDHFKHSNHFDPSKKIDFSLLGGPNYNSTTSLGIGLMASGLYSLDKTDPNLPLSNISIFSNLSISGMVMVGIRGNNIFKKDKYRLDYTTYFYTFPSKVWGIGYDAGNIDNNETEYSRIKFNFKTRFLYRLAPHTYIGPIVETQYIKLSGDSIAKVHQLMNSNDNEFFTLGGGLSFTYDSRDVITCATKGWFVQLDQMFNPSWLGNDYVYHWTDLTVATYHKAWKGAVIAGEFHSLLNYNNVPWPMLASVGGTGRMRGYFEGRYRDKNIIEAQIELRQHIKRRNGIAVWIGAANVFPKFGDMRLKKTLPNGGVGYRWAFKQGVNVRLDLGFTKNGLGFSFNINEAF